MKAAALQQAVYNRLNDSSVTSLLSSAYSPLVAIFSIGSVPQSVDSEAETNFPYLTFNTTSLTPNDTKDKVGGSAAIQIDVWSRGLSDLAINQIVDAIDGRIRRENLSISGATHITTELISSIMTDDPDGKTKHVVILYRVLFLDN